MRKSLLAAALLLAIGSLRADPLLPTGEGTSWEYNSTETLTGGVPVQSIVTVRAGRQLLDGKEVVSLETLSGNVVSKTEVVSVGENGIECLARGGRDGKIAKLNPPEAIVVAPLKAGVSWDLDSDASGINTHQHCTVGTEESITVPAGKFQAFHLQCKSSSLMSLTFDRWFVPGTGFVKETTVVRGLGFLQRTTLELRKLTRVVSKPGVTPSPSVPKPAERPSVPLPESPPTAPSPATSPGPSVNPEAKVVAPSKKLTVEVSSDPAGGMKTEFKSNIVNIYVRWHGHDLPEGAKVRVAWVAEDVGDLVEPNFIIDETETVAPVPDASARFTLGRPPDGWAEGKYRVEFYVNGQLVETVQVTIAK